MYGDFARVYDRLMAGVDYPAWALHYRSLLAGQGILEGSLLLEPACGTGSLTVELAQHYQVQPSDLSQEMLSVAAAKARTRGLNLHFLHQDMQTLRSHRPADAIVCACDGVNYLLTETALNRFLRSAFTALRPQGVLAFDVSSLDKLSRVLGNQPQLLRENDICYIWENAWQQDSRRLQLSLTLFERQADGRFLRIEEEQTQKAWAQEELVSALQAAGFEGIRCTGNFTMNPPTASTQRLHFTARKPQEEKL